jgi:hypothetical protein
MNARNLIVVLVMAGSILVAAAEDKSPSPGLEASIKAATNIVFRQWAVGPKGTKAQEFTVTDAAQVRRLTSVVRLGAEPESSCEFLQQAWFQSPSGIVIVQFNEHYFVVAEPPSPKGYSQHTYRMPKEFYAQFCKLAKEQPWHAGKP